MRQQIAGDGGSAHPAPLAGGHTAGTVEHAPVVPQHHVIFCPFVDISEIRTDSVGNDLAQDRIALLVLHALDCDGMPRRDIEHFPARFRLGVHKRVNHACLHRRVCRGHSDVARQAQAFVGPLAEFCLARIDGVLTYYAQILDALPQLERQQRIHRNAVDEPRLATGIGQRLGPKNAAVIDSIHIRQIEMPGKEAAAQLPVDLV